MTQIFAEKIRPRPQVEFPQHLEILRPSGEVFAGSIATIDITPTLDAIDQTLAQVQTDLPPSATPKPNPRHEQLFTEISEQVKQEAAPQGRSLEEGANDDWVDRQEYSHSTRVIEIVGQLAVRGALDTSEGRLAKETLRERFESSVIEMLHTDQEFRSKLEINRERQHVVREGQIMALDGKTSMTGITHRGARSAANAAAEEAAMGPIAARCGADERVAQRVEDLPVGGFLMGLSCDPKEAMARYGKKFYEEKGFREGLAFLQWYYRVDEHTLVAATYSVDHSDLQTWREVWAEFGDTIPEGEATDTWLDHDITRLCSIEEGRQLVQQVRSRFYQKRGVTPPKYSVDEFMALNQSACDEMFDSLYMNLTTAHATKQLDPALQTFVNGLLQGSRHLNDGIRRQLSGMRTNEIVGQEDVALLEQLVRYAVTERLRTGLRHLGTEKAPLVENLVAPSGMSQAQFIAQAAAGKVLIGAEAGRTYGGCTKSINPGKKDDNNPFNNRPQDAFGGLDEIEDSDDDGLGPRMFRCKKGHVNVRPRGALLTECQSAGCEKGSVGCEEKPGYAKVEKIAERVLHPLAIGGLAELLKGSKEKIKKSKKQLLATG